MSLWNKLDYCGWSIYTGRVCYICSCWDRRGQTLGNQRYDSYLDCYPGCSLLRSEIWYGQISISFRARWVTIHIMWHDTIYWWSSLQWHLCGSSYSSPRVSTISHSSLGFFVHLIPRGQWCVRAQTSHNTNNPYHIIQCLCVREIMIYLREFFLLWPDAKRCLPSAFTIMLNALQAADTNCFLLREALVTSMHYLSKYMIFS